MHTTSIALSAGGVYVFGEDRPWVQDLGQTAAEAPVAALVGGRSGRRDSAAMDHSIAISYADSVSCSQDYV